MRRTSKDLEYLVKTTTRDRTKDVDLFSEREVRLVEHGWRESKFGKTTEEGRELAKALREYAEETFKWELEEDEYLDRINRNIQRKGLAEVLEQIEFE